MKALLMSRDADFDLKQELPANASALIQDLALATLFRTMAQGDEFLFAAAQTAILGAAPDPDMICYRQQILADCLRNPDVTRLMYRTVVEAIVGEKRHYFGFMSRYPTGILHRSVDVMHGFVGVLRRLRSIAERNSTGFKSAGFCRFFAMLGEELSDPYFAAIEQHLKALRLRDGVLISAALKKGNKAGDYLLHRASHRRWGGWIEWLLGSPSAYRFTLHPRDEAGARALSELSDQGVNLAANALAQSNDHILSFFQMLRAELAFYVGCLNLHDRVEQLGERLCFPEAAASGTRRHSVSGLYDLCLALHSERPVVGNDARMDGKDLVIITGANQGGKSTFLRSIGLAQLMMQAGMFVPAASMCCELHDRVFTHFKREEDASMEHGKLDEELARLSAMADDITSRSLLLFNESFAATNEREGSEIARQITDALIEKRVKVFFVTHLYEFANGMCRRRLGNAVFLRAERREDGARTYRLTEGVPLETSYGKDLYDVVFAAAGSGPSAPAGELPRERSCNGAVVPADWAEEVRQ